MRIYSPDEYIPVVIGGSIPGTSGGGSATSAPVTVALIPDAQTAKLSGGLWTLGALTVESVTVPDWAIGFRLRPSADTRFAIGEDPVAAGAETLTVGNTAYAGETEVRLLAAGTGRSLRLLTTLAGSTVGVGFF